MGLPGALQSLAIGATCGEWTGWTLARHWPGPLPGNGILSTTMSYQLRECPLCAGRKFRPLLKARDYHYGNPGEFSQSQCTHCELAFLDPMYDEQELQEFYPKDYYAFADRFNVNPLPRSLKSRIFGFLGPREHLTRDPKFERAGNMLDIGCGAGWFLYQMREQGWTVHGVEPNVAAAEFGKSKKGLDIFPGSLPNANFPSGAFDYVRLNHSFEHMEHPNQILDEIHRILADSGKLMIGVPNRDSLIARFFGRYWYHLALPVHTFSYSVSTLSQMLAKHDFHVEKVVFNTEQTPLLGGLQIFLNRHQALPSFQGRLTRSRLAMILSYWASRIQNLLRIADVVEITATKRARKADLRQPENVIDVA
jgi:SAM-dependent methyltransferase